MKRRSVRKSERGALALSPCHVLYWCAMVFPRCGAGCWLWLWLWATPQQHVTLGPPLPLSSLPPRSLHHSPSHLHLSWCSLCQLHYLVQVPVWAPQIRCCYQCGEPAGWAGAEAERKEPCHTRTDRDGCWKTSLQANPPDCLRQTFYSLPLRSSLLPDWSASS